jgi:hypothetical protein
MIKPFNKLGIEPFNLILRRRKEKRKEKKLTSLKGKSESFPSKMKKNTKMSTHFCSTT